MGKEIISTPDAIRAAGSNISNLEVKTFCTSTASKLPLSDGNSDGLVAESINSIIVELDDIERLVDGILKKFPQKLEKVAKIIEEHDNAAANLFK